MIERRFNSPATSSAGRLFDAAASLLGLRQLVSHEGQAPMELEAIAITAGPDQVYPFHLAEPDGIVEIDTRPLIVSMIHDIEKGVESARIARRFHSTLVEAIASACRRIRQQTGLDTVVLSGGVFLNTLLTAEVPSRLSGDDFRVYRHQRVPPGDGGLCLGQLAVAAAYFACRSPSAGG
jgi:hydrogenase maturation protein HypF